MLLKGLGFCETPQRLLGEIAVVFTFDPWPGMGDTG